MNNIFVNLKRFEVSHRLGGVCPEDNPEHWIETVMEQSVTAGIGSAPGVRVVYLLPEELLLPAREKLKEYDPTLWKNMGLGCQSVFRDNVRPGKNFGAFTSNLPAASAFQIGCRWTMIGHSEERRDKQQIMAEFEPACGHDGILRERCLEAVDRLINREALTALEQGLDVLLCIGETAEERGEGSLEEQKPRIARALAGQLERGLNGVKAYLPARRVVIGYEPIWAIGPGRVPPDGEYIAFVSAFIKEQARRLCGTELPVIYGGGLKEENAAMIAHVKTIDGGLVALTRFTEPIGFSVEDLRKIIDQYIGKKEPLHETGF